jgi:hypothetical protein
MKIEDDSSLTKEWAMQEMEFPLQLLVDDGKYEDRRYKVRWTSFKLNFILY